MLHGDLSNNIMPRALVVFENAIAFLPLDDISRFENALSKGNWPKAASYWQFNELMLRKLIDLTMRAGLNIEAVSYGPEDLAPEFEVMLSDEGVPVKVWHSSPRILARKIAYMPDVMAIYDPDTSRQFTYGQKGRVLTSIHQLGG